MKKVNTGYFAQIMGLRLALLAVIIAIPICITLWRLPQIYLIIGAFLSFAIILIFFWLPNVILDSNLDKNARLHEQALEKQGFILDYRFNSGNGVFYMDSTNGKFAVVFKYNPKELQFIDGAAIDNIRTHDGRQLNNGTQQVSCRFTLHGHKQRIVTLRVSGNGTIHMKDPVVLEAISKADMICERLNAIKNRAFLQEDKQL